MQIKNDGATLNALNAAQRESQTQLNRLSSARRINQASDDAAGLVQATSLNSQSRGIQAAIKNSGDGISRLQTESGALSTITEDLQRIRELQVQAENGILSDSDKSALEAEISQRLENVRNTLDDSQFNGRNLFDGQEQSIQAGPNAGDTVEISGLDLETAITESGFDLESATNGLDQIDAALSVITERQSEVGAISNRLESSVDRLSLQDIQTQAAASRIEDTDFAEATAKKSRADIQQQVGIAVLGQANAQASDVLKLLGAS